MWKPVVLPPVPGRFRAASFRQRDAFLVWTDQGLFRFHFSGLVSGSLSRVFTVATAEQRFNRKNRTFEDRVACSTYTMYGAVGPNNEVWAPQPPNQETETWYGHALEISADGRCFTVLNAAGEVALGVVADRRSAWVVSEFSETSFLTVIEESGVRMWAYQKDKGGDAPRWSRSGTKAEAAALLKAIIDHPDDDTPRLVYADWLQEHDDPERAEYIRVQCQIAREERKGFLKPTHPLRKKEQECNQAHRWRSELPTIPGVEWCPYDWRWFCSFRRGFPSIGVSGRNFARLSRRIWATSPVEAVSLGGVREADVLALLDCPYLDRIRWLMFSPGYARELSTRLLQSPRLAGLRILTLALYMPDEVLAPLARAIATSEHLGALECLVWNGAMKTAVASILAKSKRLPALSYVRWNSWNPAPAALRTLRERFARVETE
jgi:uncharacterized protein (TIGR02996 family)